MKCLIKINIVDPLYEYHSKDWEEKDVSIPPIYKDLEVSPYINLKMPAAYNKIQYIYWNEITFKSIDDELYFRKLSLIHDII